MKFLAAVVSTVAFIFVNMDVVFGMDCNLGQSKNVIDEIIHSCPRPIIDKPSEEYCCFTDGRVSCCALPEFVGFLFIAFLPYIVALLIISCICSCICCICCRR